MRTVVVLGTRAPVGLDLARVLHRAGHRVVGADPLRWPLTQASRAVTRNARLPAPRFDPLGYARAIEALVAREAAVLVVPTCEEVFYAARADAPVFAPPPETLARLHDKGRFAATCLRHGLAAPETHRLTTPEALAPFLREADAWVFKPAFSRFGREAAVPPHPAARLRMLTPSEACPLVAQRFVRGPQVCAYAVAHAGRLAALAVYRTPYVAGGAGVFFRHEAHAHVRAWIEAFVAAERLTGQVAFDFIEGPGGRVQAIECNPRATSGLHLLRDAPGFPDAFFDAPARLVVPPSGAAFRLTFPLLVAGRRAGYDAAWRHALRTSRDVLLDPADPLPALGQLATFAEITARALRHRTGLLAASTRDIEWNGVPNSSAVGATGP